jgi:hypothetical protein
MTVLSDRELTELRIASRLARSQGCSASSAGSSSIPSVRAAISGRSASSWLPCAAPLAWH